MNKIAIIGIGDDGPASLSESARRRLDEADLILGAPRLIDSLPSLKGERRAIGADLSEAVKLLEENRPTRRIVLLASGDPLFYGVARYLAERIGKDAFEVVPHVSSMQLAFARVMESWDEALLADLSQKPLESLVDKIRVAEKVGLFTSQAVPPAAVATELVAEGIDYFRAYVCENLGSRNEVITQASLAELTSMSFGPMVVLILVRRPLVPDRARSARRSRVFGNPDEIFIQSRPKRGLITPAEVRTLALAELDLTKDCVVWDVGAGSGSLSMEAAFLASNGTVFAIEPDVEDCALIKDNAERLAVSNVEVVMGRAPEAFASLPTPQAIFIGGIGRETNGILPQAWERLAPGGRLVANVASIESVSATTALLKPIAHDVGVLLVNLSRGVHQLDTIRFEALNPNFLVFAVKSSS